MTWIPDLSQKMVLVQGLLLFLSLGSKEIAGLGMGACGRWVRIQQEGMCSGMRSERIPLR